MSDNGWTRGVEHLSVYVDETGHARVPQRHRSSDGFWLGKWVHNTRQAHRAGRLAADRVGMLEALPGWAWNARARPAPVVPGRVHARAATPTGTAHARPRTGHDTATADRPEGVSTGSGEVDQSGITTDLVEIIGAALTQGGVGLGIGPDKEMALAMTRVLTGHGPSGPWDGHPHPQGVWDEDCLVAAASSELMRVLLAVMVADGVITAARDGVQVTWQEALSGPGSDASPTYRSTGRKDAPTTLDPMSPTPGGRRVAVFYSELIERYRQERAGSPVCV